MMRFRPPETTPDQRHSTRRQNRRGALFTYYMMYLLMTGAVMAAAGVCLHTMLRSDQEDSLIAWHLQTLLRMERQLRLDAAEAATIDVVNGELILQIPAGSAVDDLPAAPEATAVSDAPRDAPSVGGFTAGRITWSLDRHIVVRRASEAGSTERFVFLFGTLIEFQPPAPDDAMSLITVRINERSPHAPIEDSRVRQGLPEIQPEAVPAVESPGKDVVPGSEEVPLATAAAQSDRNTGQLPPFVVELLLPTKGGVKVTP